MAFKLSADAHEFIPANSLGNTSQFPSRIESRDSRPVQHHHQVHHAYLPVHQGQWIAELSIAAPEFRPLGSMQLKNPVGFKSDISQRKHYNVRADQDLLSQGSRRSNRKHSGPKQRREVEIPPGIHGSRRKTGPSSPELKANDVSLVS